MGFINIVLENLLYVFGSSSILEFFSPDDLSGIFKDRIVPVDNFGCKHFVVLVKYQVVLLLLCCLYIEAWYYYMAVIAEVPIIVYTMRIKIVKSNLVYSVILFNKQICDLSLKFVFVRECG